MQEAMRGLTEGIVTAFEARATGLASIRREASAQRERNRRHVQELEKAGGKRRAAVRAEIQGVAERQRKDLAAGLAELASAVRAGLRQVTSGRRAAARQLRAALVQADAHRRPEVTRWMDELTADRLAAGQYWRQMAAALRQRRAGVVAPVAPVAPAPPEGEEGEARAEARRPSRKGRKPKAAALPDRVFAYLADHPDGVGLMEIERRFQLGRPEASRVLKSLMGEGKSKKQGLLYVAT